MPLNERIKEIQIAGKGQNAILEIIHPLKHTIGAIESVDIHVPGNGGTCQFRKWQRFLRM
jgi:hypothetical protein